MKIVVADLEFEPSIPYAQIENRVRELAQQIEADYTGRKPIMVGILTGSFLFMSDLVKCIQMPMEVSFVKLSSYFGGTSSTRQIRDDFDLTVDIKDRDLILIEDIVDTGNTMHYLIEKLKIRQPASITVCSLLLKPEALEVQINELRYVGFEIKNEFVVGYGLDYREEGRNLLGIFRKVE